jgi:hypothetical protein
VFPLKIRTLLAVGAATAAVAVPAVPVEARPGRPSFTTACGPTDVTTGARRCAYTFRYTQTIETFVVPPTTEPVEITAVGAPGGGDPGFRSRGARVTGSFSKLGGIPLFVTVGGEGWFDGYNGGAPGGGGGASDVRLGLPHLDRRIMVAGGGGGWGEQLVFDEAAGGLHRFMLVKGGDAGQPGFGAGGEAGTATTGGQGGGNDPARGQPGRLGRGGSSGGGIAGGGGGGLYGGGGGGGCSGSDAAGAPCLDSQPGSGGGGSSLVPPRGTVALSDDFEPKVVITVVRYGWWGVP